MHHRHCHHQVQLSFPTLLFLLFLIQPPTPSEAHSQLSEPQSTAPMTCRLGGEPQFGIQHCHGPCDLRAIDGHFANHASSTNPSATFRRGQRATFKYQRNNHAPGGFVRLTLVPVPLMMRKDVHTRNAFHYSCWGAHAVVAEKTEKTKDKFGFSVTGNDGEQHMLPVSYYMTRATIPECVPDGDYVLGWVWYGGVGGSVTTNSAQEPLPYGYFGDYWSCSFVRVMGGAPLKEECEAVFHNDMRQFSTEGCMSANNRPGVCSWEPCRVTGHYQKPAPFKGEKAAPRLARWMFETAEGRENGGNGGNTQKNKTASDGARQTGNGGSRRSWMKKFSGSSHRARKACRCLIMGKRCRAGLARLTGGMCAVGRRREKQIRACTEMCCRLCRGRRARHRYLCGIREIKGLCQL